GHLLARRYLDDRRNVRVPAVMTLVRLFAQALAAVYADAFAHGTSLTVEVSCFYSLSSPWAYFAGPRLYEIIRRHRARLVLKPFGMPLNLVPRHYPQDGKPAGWNKPPGWMVIAAQERGLDAQRLSHALLKALWAEERDTADRKVRVAIA